MTTLGFGQHSGQIVQLAYVVEDIHAAMQAWVDESGVGPWFLLDSFSHPQQRYRGQPCSADVSIAMAFSGHMMLELVQPKDTLPSVYRETIDKRGYGFHHIGIAVEDIAAARAAYEARGYEVVFMTPVPSGGVVYYLEKEGSESGFVELIPVTDGMNAKFTQFWKAAAEWRGEAAVRKFSNSGQ